ncbi:MAG: 50S ribosomal protein L24 [Spirochaetales bacterium]
MNSLNVKKGDNVLVIAGKEKGQTGKVLTVNPQDKNVTVAGLNIVHRHTKPRKTDEKGGIVKKEGNIDVSNVQVVCAACGKATRVAHKMIEGKKVRVCKKCGAILDIAEKKVAKTATKKATSTTKVAEKEEKAVKKVATKATTTKTTKATTKSAPKKEAVKKTTSAKTTTTARKTAGDK